MAAFSFQIGHPKWEHRPVSQPAICKMEMLLPTPCVAGVGKEILVLKHCDALIMSIPENPCLVTVHIS